MKTLSRHIEKTRFITMCVLALLVFSVQTASSLDSDAHLGQTSSESTSLGETFTSVTLSGLAYEIQKEAVFNVDLEIDCANLFIGGSIKIDWDAAVVDLVSFSFATDGPQPLIADFTQQSNSGAFVSWGWFQLEPQFSVSGVKSIGTLTLIAKSTGPLSVVSSAVAVGIAAGPLAGPGSADSLLDGAPLLVQYGGANFYVVPEPGTASLIFLGLTMLSARRRSESRRGRELF
jgi:hypothetical protein